MASATSPIDGARPSLVVSLAEVWSTFMARSCRPRGTCTAQPVSRKYRLSSPRMVGTA